MFFNMTMLHQLLLIATTLFVTHAIALAQDQGERHTDASNGWTIRHPSDWQKVHGFDPKVTKFEAPADEEIDVFRESFTVGVYPQDGVPTLTQATEVVKGLMAKVGAELIEEEQANVRLGKQPAVRLIWKFNIGGLDLRMAQLLCVVDTNVYLATLTVEASKIRQFEGIGHEMFNSFAFLNKAGQPRF